MTPTHLPEGWMPVDFGPALGARVVALMSGRAGGVSQAPYNGCNLGDHVADAPEAVARNRALFSAHLNAIRAQDPGDGASQAARPVWLRQVHGNQVVRLVPGAPAGTPEADGAFTTEPGLACTVMVADCLPVFLVAPEGRGVAALHAGWRGLAGAGDLRGQGILHTGVRALCEATASDPGDLRAWLGPCIGAAHFEVGGDVLCGFGVDPDAGGAGHPRFRPAPGRGKWWADLPGLATDILTGLGVRRLAGGTWCTVTDRSRFFSFRRDGVTGRQAASICLR